MRSAVRELVLLTAALWLSWSAFRDAVSILTLALVVPFGERPGLYAFFAARVVVASVATVGTWRGSPLGIGLGLAYLVGLSVVLFVWALLTDPILIGWASTVLSWPVIGGLVWVLLRDRRAAAAA